MGKANSPTYVVPFRRKKEGKTIYSKRLALVKSGKPRLVVRKSNRNVLVQIIEFDPKGDKTLVSVDGKKLAKKGWPARRNMPTAYLAGALAAKEALSKGIKEAVLDIGLATPTKNAIVFAAAKGAVDAGLSIPFNAELDEARIRGEHIASNKANNYSGYKKDKVKVEDIPKLFDKVAKQILEG